jgi:two-component system nitrogen regulation sensor histidine kinase NtrY
MAELDATMIGQALTNLIKNGGEAIETLQEKGRPTGFPEIRVDLQESPERCVIASRTTASACPKTGRGCSSLT